MKKKRRKEALHLHRHGRKWTSKERALLRVLYPDAITHELEERFGRTKGALTGEAHRLGIKKNWREYDSSRVHDLKPWTKQEIKRLTKLYPVTPIAQLAPHFPQRSKATIIRKANSLGLKKRYINHFVPSPDYEATLWRKQKELLKRLYPTRSNAELAERFGRTEGAIRGTAWKMGLHKAGYVPGERTGTGSRLWTRREDALLRKLYPTAWTKKLAQRLGRTEASVGARASILGVRKDPEKFTPPPRPGAWSAKEIERLKRLRRQGHTMAEIGEILGRATSKVNHQLETLARDCGLARRARAKPWSQKDEKYLVRHHGKKSCKQIATALGRTAAAVRGRAVHLGITKPNLWSARDIKRLRALWRRGHTAAEIAEMMGRSTHGVRGQVQRQKQDFGLPDDHDTHRWSKEQTAYLIKHYKNMSARELGFRLERTPQSIFAKARKLGLLGPAYAAWSTGQTNMLIRYYPRWSAARIAEKLGKTRSAVQAKVRGLGLGKRDSFTGQMP